MQARRMDVTFFLSTGRQSIPFSLSPTPLTRKNDAGFSCTVGGVFGNGCIKATKNDGREFERLMDGLIQHGRTNYSTSLECEFAESDMAVPPYKTFDYKTRSP